MSELKNGNDENKFQNILNKSTISKILSSISSTDNPKYLFESLNKLFLNKIEAEKFIINLFQMKNQKEENTKDFKSKYSLKLKELIYFIIVNFNYDFFNDFTKEKQLIFDEKNFINECQKENIEFLSNVNYNTYGSNNLLFHKYFIIIAYFLLRYKYQNDYNKNQIEIIMKCLNNSELNEIFFDIFSSSSMLLNNTDNKKSLFELNCFKKYDFITKLINNYSTNKSIFIPNFSKN